jgi:hypothetical protein
MEDKKLTNITIQRFMKELDKLKQDVDSGALQPKDYDGRLARVIGELRERGLDADRDVARAALADAVARGVLTAPMKEHIERKLGLT